MTSYVHVLHCTARRCAVLVCTALCLRPSYNRPQACKTCQSLQRLATAARHSKKQQELRAFDAASADPLARSPAHAYAPHRTAPHRTTTQCNAGPAVSRTTTGADRGSPAYLHKSPAHLPVRQSPATRHSWAARRISLPPAHTCTRDPPAALSPCPLCFYRLVPLAPVLSHAQAARACDSGRSQHSAPPHARAPEEAPEAFSDPQKGEAMTP